MDPAPFAHPFPQIEDAAPLQDSVDEFAAEFGIVHRVFDDVETRHIPARRPGHPEFFPGQQVPVEKVHQPCQHSPRGDGVEPHGVAVVVELFRGPLVEDAAQGAHGLVRLVVLLVDAVHLLADRDAGLPAGGLLPGDNGLFVELPEVVVDNEVLVQAFSLLLGPEDSAVVESQDFCPHSGVVDTKGAAGSHLLVIAVLGGGLQVLLRQAQVVLVPEPFIGHLAVPEVLVHHGAAVDDRHNAVVPDHGAAEAAAAGPGIDVADLALVDGDRHDSSHVGMHGRGTGDQDAWVVLVAASRTFRRLCRSGNIRRFVLLSRQTPHLRGQPPLRFLHHGCGSDRGLRGRVPCRQG